MKPAAVATAVAVSFSFGIIVNAARLPQQTQTSSAAAATDNNKLNIEGCVFPKRALNAKEPVAASSSGTEDYILSDTKIVSASPGLENLDGRVFKLDDVAQDRLRDFTGKRVGVNGRVDTKPEPAVLRALSVWETVGSCPKVPTPQK
ncbi:MAG TPA: hypothetical protein VJP86_04400 [Vicinamibacterales bacterium]|nr:hypothetical protein [Vicinamibacterales bacterium]